MNRTGIFTFLILTLISVSCKGPEKRIVPPPTVDSDRKSHYGKAVISVITDSKQDSGVDIKGYVDIYFNFVLSNPGGKDKYLCGECPDNNIKLFYDNRESFHVNWVKKWDIKPGSEYPAVRHEMIRSDKSASVSHEVFLEPAKQD